MMRLWNLLTLRPKMRCFALLDSNGHCRALRECREVPLHAGWVEVLEIRPHWLGQTLPYGMLVQPGNLEPARRPLLAA